ncbi:MAG: hypothetical protein WBB01_16870, partial [Phormidesmis sp.]
LLGWQPRYEDLDIILETALEWETRLLEYAAATQVRRPERFFKKAVTPSFANQLSDFRQPKVVGANC